MLFIADQLKRSYKGEAWHGPCVEESLAGVTWQQAFDRPIAGAHSIAELVVHLAVWVEQPLLALNGKPWPNDIPVDLDWPEAHRASAANWEASLTRLRAAEESIIALVRNLTPEQLEVKVTGKPFTTYFMLNGVVQHNIYHAGQIMLLRKLL